MISVTCLLCYNLFEVPEDSNLRICPACLAPDAIIQRVDRLKKYRGILIQPLDNSP